jgi:hypothetical protein
VVLQKISPPNHVTNEDVLDAVEEERNEYLTYYNKKMEV